MKEIKHFKQIPEVLIVCKSFTWSGSVASAADLNFSSIDMNRKVKTYIGERFGFLWQQ